MLDIAAFWSKVKCGDDAEGFLRGRKSISSRSRAEEYQLPVRGAGKDLLIIGLIVSFFASRSISSSPLYSSSARSRLPWTANPTPLNPSQTRTKPSNTFGNLASSVFDCILASEYAASESNCGIRNLFGLGIVFRRVEEFKWASRILRRAVWLGDTGSSGVESATKSLD